MRLYEPKRAATCDRCSSPIVKIGDPERWVHNGDVNRHEHVGLVSVRDVSRFDHEAEVS